MADDPLDQSDGPRIPLCGHDLAAHDKYEAGGPPMCVDCDRLADPNCYCRICGGHMCGRCRDEQQDAIEQRNWPNDM